jgi:hypothetical protein
VDSVLARAGVTGGPSHAPPRRTEPALIAASLA